MRRSAADTAVAAGFATAGVAVLLAPAVSTRWGGVDASVGSLDKDILAASLVVSTAHLAAVGNRRRHERRTGCRRAHAWMASLNALVVLALSASLLVLGILYWFPDEHASIADRGLPIVLLWGGIQLVAVVLAETTARVVLRWLRPASPRGTTELTPSRTRHAGRLGRERALPADYENR